jgi:hypothetical protein
MNNESYQDSEYAPEKTTNYHKLLTRFYDSIVVDNEINKNKIRFIRSIDELTFKVNCPEKDESILNHFYSIRNSFDNNLLTSCNFDVKYKQNEYTPVVVENVFKNGVHEHIKDYFHFAINNGKYTQGDRQSKRFKSHNDFICRILHYELLPLIEHVTNRELIPTYTYLSGYVRGCDLPPHTDRDDCEFTVSYVLDKSDYNWNIYVDPRHEPVGGKGRYANYDVEKNISRCLTVDCNANGLMMFMGTHHVHFREVLEADYYYIILFHFKSK